MLRNHIIPQYYLKGFCDKEGKIFQYTKGIDQVVHTYPKNVAVEKGFYSEQLENELSITVENPANSLLGTLRQRQQITPDDKFVLAVYLANLLKRTRKGREKAQKLMPKVVDERFEATEQVIIELIQRYPLKRANIERQWEALNRKKEDFKNNLLPEVWHHILKAQTTIQTINALSKLVWEFHYSDKQVFFTSDNPVFYTEAIGLGKALSEISFPISSTIVLKGTNLVTLGLQFYRVSDKYVEEVNNRTIQGASRYIFHCEDSAQLLSRIKDQK